jgi:hypothetical protein
VTRADNSASLTASFQYLGSFLQQAKTCGLLAVQGAAPSANHTLGSTLLQQLQQSGLPQALPATLSAATQRLQRVIEDITHGAAAAQDTNCTTTTSSSSSSGAASICGISQWAVLASMVLEVFGGFLDLTGTAQQAVLTPAAAAATMELAIVVLKHTDCVLQQQQQQQRQQRQWDSEELLGVLSLTAMEALRIMQGLLILPALLTFGGDTLPIVTNAITVSTVVAVHYDTLQLLVTGDPSSSSSSSSSSQGRRSQRRCANGCGSSSSSSSGIHGRGSQGTCSCCGSSKYRPGEAWDLVLQHQQQLPTFHPMLFDVLGLSQRLLAWLAVYALGKLQTVHSIQRSLLDCSQPLAAAGCHVVSW